MNLYAFGGNDPINKIDPSGTDDYYYDVEGVQTAHIKWPATDRYFLRKDGNVYQIDRRIRNQDDLKIVLSSLFGPANGWEQASRNTVRGFNSNGEADVDIDFHKPHGNQPTGRPHAHRYDNDLKRGPWEEVQPEQMNGARTYFLSQFLQGLTRLLGSTEVLIPIIVVPGTTEYIQNRGMYNQDI